MSSDRRRAHLLLALLAVAVWTAAMLGFYFAFVLAPVAAVCLFYMAWWVYDRSRRHGRARS